MHTRLARPRRLQLAAAGMLIMLGIAGAGSTGVPEAPVAQHASKAGAPNVAPAEASPREFKLDHLAQQIPGTGTLRYPAAMRRANREGEVLAQFVVDTTGRAEMGSYKVLKTTHELFGNAVKNALSGMRFIPAEVGGRKVRQLVQQPFTFAISK